MTIRLDAGEVLVLVARLARSPELEALLDDGERDRVAQLRREDDRRRFVAAHALARLVLSEITGLPPTILTFDAHCPRCGGRHGMTRLRTAEQLHFSTTHAAERVAVAVTTAGPVGVDLEPAEAGGFAGFADVALTPNERAEYVRLPVEERPRAATTWWVRKEAVLKATGHGMFVSPEDVETSSPADEPRLIAWHADGGPTVPIHLVDLRLGPAYIGCTAALSHQAPRVQLTDGTDLLATWGGSARTATP